jgi:hypothetical protein
VGTLLRSIKLLVFRSILIASEAADFFSRIEAASFLFLEKRGRPAGDGPALSNRAQPFVGFGLDTQGLLFQPENGAQGGFHTLDVRSQLRLLEDDDDIHMGHPPAFVPDEDHGFGKKSRARRIPVSGIRIREKPSDVSLPESPEQGVDDGVNQGIAIRMS